MDGTPLSRTTSPDGRWAYTLYSNHEQGPIRPRSRALHPRARHGCGAGRLHRPPTARGTPHLVRLGPADGFPGRRLAVLNRPPGQKGSQALLEVDTRSFEVRRPTPVATASSGLRSWQPIAALSAGALLLVAWIGVRQRGGDGGGLAERCETATPPPRGGDRRLLRPRLDRRRAIAAHRERRHGAPEPRGAGHPGAGRETTSSPSPAPRAARATCWRAGASPATRPPAGRSACSSAATRRSRARCSSSAASTATSAPRARSNRWRPPAAARTRTPRSSSSATSTRTASPRAAASTAAASTSTATSPPAGARSGSGATPSTPGPGRSPSPRRSSPPASSAPSNRR